MWGKGLLSESVHLTSPHSIFSLPSSPPSVPTGFNWVAMGLQSLSKESLGGLPMYLALRCPHADYCALPTWNVPPCPWHTTHFSSSLETDENHSIRLLKDSHPSHSEKEASNTHKSKEGRCLKSAIKSFATLCWANCFEVIILDERKGYQSYLLTFEKVSVSTLVTKGQFIFWLKESSRSSKVSAGPAVFC